MKKLKAFFYVYKNSMTSPKYYKEVLKTDLNFSLKYYFMLVLFASTLITTIETILVVPNIKTKIMGFAESARQTYPEDLIIKIEEGKWSVNREEPFVIPMPQIPNENVPENAIVFYRQGTISDVDLFDTVVLVNDVNIVVRGANGIQARSLDNVPDIEVNKETFDNFIEFLFSFTRFLPYIIFIATLLGLLIYFIFFRLFYSLFLGAAIYALSLLNKKPLNYMGSYRIGLHTMTLPITFQVVLALVRSSLRLPLWFFILNIFFALVVLSRMEEPSLKKKK
ncbi:MAG: DUF1189 family protein [Patescibacteria group bacterium]